MVWSMRKFCYDFWPLFLGIIIGGFAGYILGMTIVKCGDNIL